MKARISMSISPSLRHRLEEAREKSGRSLSQEVEARLRLSFRQCDGDELVLLKVDSGLMAWFRAFVAGPGFFGNLQQTLIYFLRCQLIELMEHDCWYGPTVPLLPEPMRTANMRTPKYQRIAREQQERQG